MDEFDDILRQKLSDPPNVPDSGGAWNKIRAGLYPGVPGYWRTAALIGLLLWLATMGLWYASSTNKPGEIEKNIENNGVKTELKPSTDRVFIHDTIVQKVYLTKWKTSYINKVKYITAYKEPKVENTIKQSEISTVEDQQLNTNFLSSPKITSVESNSIGDRENIDPLNADEKLPVITPKALARWEAGVYIGKSNFVKYLVQNKDYAPVIKSDRYSIAVRYRLWKGLGLNAGFTHQTSNYKADSIIYIAADKLPNFIAMPNDLKTLKFSQVLNTVSTGISYHFNLKNNWFVGIGSGLDWNISGKKDNEYYYFENVYTPIKSLPSKKEATFLKAETAYVSLGLDIPIFSNWYLSGRFKKHFLIKKSDWLIPDYSGEIGINYYFK